MIIIGLTGSIAMGKSHAAKMFRRLNVPVFDADAAVAKIYQKAVVRQMLQHRFGENIVQEGQVHRPTLRQLVQSDSQAKRWLENAIHPLVRQHYAAFIRQQVYRRTRLTVLDIPLLLETGADRFCDVIIVASCPAFIQAQRFLRRPMATPALLASYRQWQYPDYAKRQAADFVIATGLSKAYTFRQIKRLYQRLYHA